MINNQVKIRGGGDFNTAPADKYTCQIMDVNPKRVYSKFTGQEEDRLDFSFVILDDKPLAPGTEGTTRGIRFWHTISPTLGQKSWLRKLAKGVLGRELAEDESDEKSKSFINPDDWVGKQVDVMLSEEPSKDSTVVYNNAIGYSKTVNQLKPLESKSAGQTVVDSKSEPAMESADVPNLNPELDKFLGEVEGGDSEDQEEDSVEVLEAKIKLAKAKAKVKEKAK